MAGGLLSVMKGEPLVTKLAAVAKYAVLPGAMIAALIYSPPHYALPNNNNNNNNTSRQSSSTSN